MPAGRDVVDALECVLSVFFSNVRHRNRAAFLLCDELVEMICKAKMREEHSPQKIAFHQLLKHASVGLDPDVPGLGKSLQASHQTRNHMQHASAAATVDDQHCADAILDAIEAMDHCFPAASSDLPDGLKTSLPDRSPAIIEGKPSASKRFRGSYAKIQVERDAKEIDSDFTSRSIGLASLLGSCNRNR